MANKYMISHTLILSIIKDCTSQQPMTKADLLSKSCFSESELNTALIEMYALGKINQCKHTKLGVTDYEYWPTGVSKIVGDYGRNFTESPLRRDAIMKEKTMPLNETKTISAPTSKKYKETADKRPTALKVLEFIEANPNCSFKEIQKGSGVDFPLAYIKTPIHRGKVIATKHENYKNTYKLADGCTAGSIYVKKGVKHPKQVTLAVKEEFDIPAFLRKPAEKTDEFAVADSVDERLGDQWPEEPHDFSKIITPTAPVDYKSHFKVALTTDKTLMLFGLDYQPIELTKQQTMILTDFIGQWDIEAFLV